MDAETPPWLSDRQQRVWRQYLNAHEELNAAVGRQLNQEWGLSTPDFQVLVRLSESANGRVRIVELADTLLWERSRLSHHLTRMQKRDLIVRQECPDDRRGAFAVLTHTGRKLLEQAAPSHADLVRRLVFDPLTEGDLDSMDAFSASLLSRLTAHKNPG